ncbi:hypothetical protein ILUMI_10452 [Ignelater luminosus]|uniref:RING-type domain-containing protein n=1 Tax=Ignelater luminosus TaxID=2038154 RepID=A0A8K0D3A2_IGNLU|nr:hypothetical protein ILUMI_10452 [Ignelater luminosus]
MANANVIIPNAVTKLQAFKDELRCVICYDYFTHAITLSCSHTFCLRCISSWLIIQLVCPTCRKRIYAITPSKSLDNMVAKLRDATDAQHLVGENLGNANFSHRRCMRLLKKLTAYVKAFSRYCMSVELDEIMLQQFQIVRDVQRELENDDQTVESEVETEHEEYEEQAEEENEEDGGHGEEYEEYYTVEELGNEEENGGYGIQLVENENGDEYGGEGQWYIELYAFEDDYEYYPENYGASDYFYDGYF